MTKSRLGKVWTFFLFFNIYEKRVCLNFDTPSFYLSYFKIVLLEDFIKHVSKTDTAEKKLFFYHR